MKRALRFGFPLTALGLLFCPAVTLAQTSGPGSTSRAETWKSILDHDRPRLVVVLTFDQFKADLLTRFSNHFLPASDKAGKPGGFRYILENGAAMVNAHYTHVPLHTGPGHATIMTGASPRFTGIVANDWNTSMGLRTNCVADPEAYTLGMPGKPRKGSSSPRNLLAQTVGDELKLTNNNKSKVFGIAIKDRGAILPTGHTADGAVWFDSSMGRWVTSTYYTTGTLPAFAQRFNDEKVADRWFGKEWDYLLPKEVYDISMPEGMRGVGEARGLPATFPKRLSEPDDDKPSKSYYNKMIFSPYGNEMVFETAKMAVEDQQLGKDDFADILAVSFSTTDLIGHSWGGHSREAQDSMLRVDRQLADFLGFLDKEVSGGLDNVVLVITADHGGMTLPEYAQDMGLKSERLPYDDLDAAAKAALTEAFPDKQTTDIVAFSDPHFVFRLPVMEQRGIDVEQAADVVAKAIRRVPGITAAYTRKQIENGALPNTWLAQSVSNGFNPDRCGELIVVSDPLSYNSRGKTGSTHGTPWNYDSTVPILFMGKHVTPGVYTDKADVRDIAPTLSFFLGITPPASSEGRILTEIIK